MHPYIMYDLAKARQNDILREAQQQRLVRQAFAGHPSMIARIRERLGGLLIKIGGQLQNRHVPQSTVTLGLAKN